MLIFTYLWTHFPELVAIWTTIGALRTIFKPLQGIVDSAVLLTPTKMDDEKWQKIKASKAYQLLAWLIDFASSIKLPGREVGNGSQLQQVEADDAGITEAFKEKDAQKLRDTFNPK